MNDPTDLANCPCCNRTREKRGYCRWCDDADVVHAEKQVLLKAGRELEEALEGMLYQFAYETDSGGLWCGGLSALEHAFGAIHWDEPHALPSELICDDPFCRRRSTSGTPTPDGYRRTCSYHIPKLEEVKP